MLIVGALRRRPAYIVPWLCANSVLMGVLLVLVAFLLFFGYVRMALKYDEYVSVLSLIGCLAGGHFFACLVVFQVGTGSDGSNDVKAIFIYACFRSYSSARTCWRSWPWPGGAGPAATGARPRAAASAGGPTAPAGTSPQSTTVSENSRFTVFFIFFNFGI